MSDFNNNQTQDSGSIPVRVVAGGSGSGARTTPVAGTASAVTAGGTPVVAVVGPINGGYIANPLTLAGQGIAAAEPLYIDMVGSPGSTDAAGNGTTITLAPGDTFTLPALNAGIQVKANAATSGHKFTTVVW